MQIKREKPTSIFEYPPFRPPRKHLVGHFHGALHERPNRPLGRRPSAARRRREIRRWRDNGAAARLAELPPDDGAGLPAAAAAGADVICYH